MGQMSIFDVLVAPTVYLTPDQATAIEPKKGEFSEEVGVLTSPPMYQFKLKNPRKNWKGLPHAKITIHPLTDKLWIWSTSYTLEDQGSGYYISLNARRFAQNADDALHYACEELKKRLEGKTSLSRIARQILAWTEELKQSFDAESEAL